MGRGGNLSSWANSEEQLAATIKSPITAGTAFLRATTIHVEVDCFLSS